MANEARRIKAKVEQWLVHTTHEQREREKERGKVFYRTSDAGTTTTAATGPIYVSDYQL
jgi:hypothetical protein